MASIEREATDALTNDKKPLYDNIADHGRAIRIDETSVVGDDDSHIERGNQDQPVPAALEGTIMGQDESGLL